MADDYINSRNSALGGLPDYPNRMFSCAGSLAMALRRAAIAVAIAIYGPPWTVSAQETEVVEPLSLSGTAVRSEDTSTKEPETLSRSFGPSGLLAEFNNNENFGNVQSRLGALRTHQAFANAGGPQSGYRDRFENWVFPLKATVSIPDKNRDWYIRVATTLSYSRGLPGNFTRTSTDSYTKQLHLIRRFGDRTAIGVGLISTDAEVDLLHNGGAISNSGLGVQLDAMHRFTPQIGIAGRLIHDAVDRRTTIPLGAGRTVDTEREGNRTYVEASLVLALNGDRSSLVPEGWRLRPVLTGVYQKTELDGGQNTAGLVLPRGHEQYAAAMLTARLESTRFAPWDLIPYFESGAEFGLHNDATQVDDDQGNIYLRAGLAMNVGGAGRLDVYLIRRDSFEGTFDATNFSVLLNLQL